MQCVAVFLFGLSLVQAVEQLKVSSEPPNSWDWRTVAQQNTLTSVKDQSLCNSGWAHAAVAAYEQYIKRINGSDYDLSEQYLIQCSGLSNCTYESRNLRRIMEFLIENGLPTEQNLPYSSGTLTLGKAQLEDPCGKPKIKVASTIKSHGSVGLTWAGLRGDLVKVASVCTFNSTERFKQYAGGVYSCTDDDAPLDIRETNHAVLAVGYTSSNNIIIKNSFGDNWGEKGYANIDYKNDCGLRLMCYQLSAERLLIVTILLILSVV